MSDLGDSPLAESRDPDRVLSEDRDVDAPIANPDLDMDDDDNAAADQSDNESELSEVDEDEFADFDPTTVALDENAKPKIDIDHDIAKSLKATKRKKTDEGKTPKEGGAKREKKKRARRDDDDEDPDGELMEGKRSKKSKTSSGDNGERRKDRPVERRQPSPENEANLTPAERRARALDRAMDAALKNPNKRRRKKDEVVSVE